LLAWGIGVNVSLFCSSRGFRACVSENTVSLKGERDHFFWLRASNHYRCLRTNLIDALTKSLALCIRKEVDCTTHRAKITLLVHHLVLRST